MTSFNFDLTSAINKARDQAKIDIENSVAKYGKRISDSFLNDGKYFGKEGMAHEIIRKHVEDYILSDEFSKKCKDAVINCSDEEIDRAARALVNSKARKHLFQPTSPIEAERDDEWIIIMDGTPEKVVWDMELGWIPLTANGTHDVFSSEEKNKFKLPMGGMWMKKTNLT